MHVHAPTHPHTPGGGTKSSGSAVVNAAVAEALSQPLKRADLINRAASLAKGVKKEKLPPGKVELSATEG